MTDSDDATTRTTVGDCPVCGRVDVELTIKPPIRDDHPWRIACADERACFAAYCAR